MEAVDAVQRKIGSSLHAELTDGAPHIDRGVRERRVSDPCTLDQPQMRE